MKKIKRIIEFIRNGIWQAGDSSSEGQKDPWYIRPFKIILYTFKGFGEHQIVLRAAALTFYTLVTIVPIAALIFAIVRGFGVDTNFTEYLYLKFPEYRSIIDAISGFAEKMLLRTKGGVIASVGVVVLLWAVMRIFGNVEKAFNSIWEIKKQRKFARKFSDYVAVIFIAPLLWVLSNGISLYIRNTLSYYTVSWVVELLYALGSLVIIWLMFCFIYYVMPNTKVKFKSALIAGVIAGTFFQIFQVGYFWVQSQVSNYNAVYGSFAALPLFLVWLQASWGILLFGAEISFAYQNVRRYEQERESMHMSTDSKRKVLLAAMLTIVQHFMEKSGPVTPEEVAVELDMPVRIVSDVIFELETAGFVVSVASDTSDKINRYIPAQDVHTIKIFDIIDKVEKSGTKAIDIDDSDELAKVSRIVDELKARAYDSPMNVYLTDLIKS